MKRLIQICLLCLPVVGLTAPVPEDKNFVDTEAAPWQESDYVLPPYPKAENLMEFYVSAATATKFYVDQSSIGTGTADGVVRYVMVVRTGGGAVNTSYEGIRCTTNEFRVYAIGNNEDAVWNKTRNSEWRRFKGISNPQQKSLANLYFCPDFTPIKTADEGRQALKLGEHPLVKQRYLGD